MGDSYETAYGLRARAFEPGEGSRALTLRQEDVEPYLVERLRAVGWQGTPMLDLGLAPLLHEATGGDTETIDRAMSALLDAAARAGRTVVEGDGLAAWLDGEQAGEAPPSASGLAEAQIEAIEGAFAEQDRRLARLRRELADLRSGTGYAAPAPGPLLDRLEAIESRLDQQEQALRHVVERLIAFFEEGRE